MSYRSKVVWTEGMFLRPQHFQQQDRFIEDKITELIRLATPNHWGFIDLKFDNDLLKIGKLSLSSAQGIFPDGSIFNIPGNDQPPKTIDVDISGPDPIDLYLCLPLQREDTAEVAREDNSNFRYQTSSIELRDSSYAAGLQTEIDVAKPNIQFRSGNDDLSGYTVLPLARILPDGEAASFNLDAEFIPPLLSTACSDFLVSKIKEILGLIQYRAEALAGRLTSNDRNSSSSLNDFMFLQLLNRCEPLLNHYLNNPKVHPNIVYVELIQILGELSSFAEVKLRPQPAPEYHQNNLSETFSGLFGLFRRYLSVVHEQTAILMPLAERKYGISVSPIEDRSLLDTCKFVLSVQGKFDKREIKKSLPSLLRLAPVEKIRDILSAQTSGIRVWPLDSDPREVPFSSGAVYFELEQTGELWQLMKNSGGFAVHPGMDVQDLKLELWAIRTE